MNATRLLAALCASSLMAAGAGAQTGTDSCLAPDALAGQGSFAFDSTLATTGLEGQAELNCFAFGNSAIDNDVWFSWTADATGTAIVSTCSVAFDTKIAAYPAGGCPTVGSSLACNDDTCALQSQISFPVTNATAYTLQVGTFPGAAGGSGLLDISIALPATNDNCTNPVVILGQGSFGFDTSAASAGIEGQTEALCYFIGSTVVDRDVWFTWTADANGLASIETCASGLDTKIAAYSGAGCPVAGTAIACADDNCALSTNLQMIVTTGTVYTLQVGAFPGAAGGIGNLDITIVVPAANNDCTAASALAGQGSFPFSQIGATTGLEGQAEILCYAFGSSVIDNDVWYSWTADATGIAIIGTCTSLVDTKIAVYAGTGCPALASALACNDDSCGLQTSLQFATTLGSVYTLQVGTFPGATGGTGLMDISIVPPAPNDGCATPSAIAGQGSFPFSQIGASTGAEGQAEILCYNIGSSVIDNDVWYSWTADATGTAVIGTCSTIVDTKIAVYAGTGCPLAGSAIACNDDACGLQTTVLANVTNGTVYSLQVGTFPGAAGGTGMMDISIVPPLLADDCNTPDVIAGQGNFPYDTSIASTGAEGQNEASCYAFGTSGITNDMWFSWTPDATGPATISTCTALFDTKIAAYPGGACPTIGSSLACNDDTCGLQSTILFPVVSGTSYMLQVGNFPGAGGGLASLDISIAGPAEPGTPFCFCTVVNAPCANGGAPGNGCANGSNPAGGNLTATGVATVGADSLVLSASGLAPGQPGLYFQGDNAVNGGLGIVFGDGIRCAGGGVQRLGVAGADAGGTSSTAGFAVAISVQGGVIAGALKHYQLWYRGPVASPCGAFFNLTNGYSVQW
ncbi:MAG: hypothetical protein ABGY71_11855 [bacterium]|nr:hypothetical protein [Planctomycetota bacterium]HIL51509.1 hypothetical protein [Planctomycetota bacterium]